MKMKEENDNASHTKYMRYISICVDWSGYVMGSQWGKNVRETICACILLDKWSETDGRIARMLEREKDKDNNNGNEI